MSENSPLFYSAQANLSAPWMALARRPMLQQGLKCFKEKNKKIKKFGWWLCCVPIPLPPRRSRRARRLRQGREGIVVFQEIIIFLFFYFLFFIFS
jgi:hypothetical protein